MTAVAADPAAEVDKPGGIPYERIVQWAAGPIAIVAGAVAVWLDNHFGLLGKAGLGKDETAKAIFDSLTFAVGAAVTYLSHSKWMNNLAAWWTHAQTTVDAAAEQRSLMAAQDDYIRDRVTVLAEEDLPAREETEDGGAEQSDEPFVDEPGYDDDGPGVEPDQELDGAA